MKRYLLVAFSILLTEIAGAQLVLPVRNLQVEDNLLSSWDAPRKTLLTQDFEGNIFPPPGWQELSNHAVGWFMSEGGSSTYFIIPPHTQYALVNDDAGGPGIDGCCEYLITPELDLTVCDGFQLMFDSYFNGNNGQKATIEMSTDNGVTWNLVQEMVHYPTWNQIVIDLSQWSGAGGLSAVKFAFHADDQGNQASGWAVDNVVIQSDSLGVNGYTLFLDQNQIADITETEYFISPELVTYGQNYSFCVRANYPSGFADTCVQFTSFYLLPPANLTATSSDTGVWFTWQTPISASEIISYNIYSEDAIIANVPVSVTSWFSELEFGEACIYVTAIHDISIYGFPGMFAESIKETACGFVDTGFDLPFEENWTSGTLTLNKWTAGSNWSITGQVGNEAPSVKYEGGKSPGGYSSALTSWHFNSMGFSECPSIIGAELNFFIRLDDVTASKTEVLIVEVVTDIGVTEIKRYTNNGSFTWLNEWIEITSVILDYNFQVRFRVEGENSQNIEAWFIDKIKVVWYISDFPDSFAVNAVRQGIPEDDIKVTWLDYVAVNEVTDIIVDDGTAESQFSMGSNGELWIGNKLEALDSTYLFKASVYIKELQGTSAIYTIDIFDGNRNYIQSSMPFMPVNNAFTEVYLNGVFLQGEFYVMLHIISTGYSHALGIDTNGSNAGNELSWFFDGTNWNKLIDNGFTQGVFSLRASTMIMSNVPVTDNHCGFLGYNIYRRDYSVFPTGPNNSGSGEYIWIGSVPYGVNEFIDKDLDNFQKNCYEYDVRIQYAEGEGYGNFAWDCIYVGTKEPEEVSVTLYPNPASDLLMVKMNSTCERITVYNLTGTKIVEFSVKNETEIQLNVSHFVPGIYNISFNTAKDESFSRKFIKL